MSFIQNPNPSPDPRIFLKIRPNPFNYKILRSVTTLAIGQTRLPKSMLC